MKHALFVLAAIAIAPVFADEPLRPPEGPAPDLVPAKIGPTPDNIAIARPVAITKMETVTEKVPYTIKVLEGGKVVERTEVREVQKAVPRQTTVFATINYSVKSLEIYDLNWKRVAADEVRDRLGDKSKPVILIHATGKGEKELEFKKPDPFYLKALKDDTLIVVLPAERPLPAPPVPAKP